jgi:hypothetical protein
MYALVFNCVRNRDAAAAVFPLTLDVRVVDSETADRQVLRAAAAGIQSLGKCPIELVQVFSTGQVEQQHELLVPEVLASCIEERFSTRGTSQQKPGSHQSYRRQPRCGG